MTKKIPYFLGIIITILLGTWLQYIFCCGTTSAQNSKSVEKVVVTPIRQTNNNLSGFNFTFDNTTFKTNENFKFKSSNFLILEPISDSILLGIENLKEKLNSSNLKFNITGNFKTSEENNSIFPDLGLARATSVKNFLVNQGIKEDKITISSTVDDNLENSNDTLINSIHFNLINEKTTAAEVNTWNQLKRKINKNPIRLYFNTGQSTIELTQQEKIKLGQIIDYLNHIEGSKILITGHTDNTTGPNHSNEYHSLKRAEFAKNYLISNGVSANKILAEGKAEKMPIATNETDEGRAKNRRTEISIK